MFFPFCFWFTSLFKLCKTHPNFKTQTKQYQTKPTNQPFSSDVFFKTWVFLAARLFWTHKTLENPRKPQETQAPPRPRNLNDIGQRGQRAIDFDGLFELLTGSLKAGRPPGVWGFFFFFNIYIYIFKGVVDLLIFLKMGWLLYFYVLWVTCCNEILEFFGRVAGIAGVLYRFSID